MDYAKSSDRELAAAFRGGCPQAFAELAARYLGAIRMSTQSFRELEAEDLCQEGLIALMIAAHTYREEDETSFKTYAQSCILHRFISIQRKHHAKKAIPAQSLLPMEEEARAADVAVDPETIVIEQENLQQLRAKIFSVLSKLELQIFGLYLAGYSYEEISEKLSLPKKSVDNALTRVRRKIRASLNVGQTACQS